MMGEGVAKGGRRTVTPLTTKVRAYFVRVDNTYKRKTVSYPIKHFNRLSGKGSVNQPD